MLPITMKAPGDYRAGIWRGRVLQLKVTNICSLDCKNCTAAVGIAKAHKRFWTMTPDQFQEACRSLKGFGGVVGVFGGNPTTSKFFSDYCRIMKEEIPDKDQRGLWSNDLRGHAALCRDTFSPSHSNLNVHRNEKAYEEIEREWPEAIAARREFMLTGRNRPSMHGSWWVQMKDVIPDEAKRWALIGKCFVNQTWSAEITVINGELRAYFCEFAATRAEFADLLGEEEVGLPVTPGWWAKPMSYFEKQVCHHCHRCGAPLNPEKIEDLGSEPEEYSPGSRGLFEGIKRPSKCLDASEAVSGANGGVLVGSDPATGYLGNACLATQHRKS